VKTTGKPSRSTPAGRNGSARVAPPPGQPGASSNPPLAADAAVHTGTSPSCGHRAATAAAAPAIAATAAATSPAAPAGITGSGPVRASSTVKNTRTSSARPANRRSHPRTVAAARPSCPAILRCPSPPAADSSAAPITAAASARRSRHHAGSSTCVPLHWRHRDLRGTTSASGPRITRTGRSRPFPHPPSTPPHDGHVSSPPASCRSTSSRSPFTVSTTPPRVTQRPSPGLGQKITGRAAPQPIRSPCRPGPHTRNPAPGTARPRQPAPAARLPIGEAPPPTNTRPRLSQHPPHRRP